MILTKGVFIFGFSFSLGSFICVVGLGFQVGLQIPSGGGSAHSLVRRYVCLCRRRGPLSIKGSSNSIRSYSLWKERRTFIQVGGVNKMERLFPDFT